MPKKKITYEEAYAKLEEILSNMEKGELSLNDSMESFKEANELYKYCEELLGKAEGEVKIILENDLEDNFSVEV